MVIETNPAVELLHLRCEAIRHVRKRRDQGLAVSPVLATSGGPGTYTGTMRVLERYVMGKHPDPRLCEDIVVVSGPLVAVIDGDTDKSGLRIPTADGEVTAGRFAALVVAAAVEDLAPGTPPLIAVAELTAALATAAERACPQVAPHERPSAAIVVLDAVGRWVWRVGDTHFRVDGAVWYAKKRIDRVASEFRAAFLAASSVTDLATETVPGGDPGREAILPLLRLQGNVANRSGEFGYGTLNGTAVPAEFIDVVELPAGVCEVVLASDGYPALGSVLADAEADLARLLDSDPSCVGVLRSTKGLAAGMVSFDDRSWVRVTFDS